MAEASKAKVPEMRADPETIPFLRWVKERVVALDRELARLITTVKTSNKSQSAAVTLAMKQVRELRAVVDAIPYTFGDSQTETGFGLTGTFVSYSAVGFRVPEGKTRGVVTVIINGQVLDTVTGGVTVAKGLINFGTLLSQEFSASKDAGASQVNNIITGTHTYNVQGLDPGAYYSVNFEMKGLNGSAFPANAGNFALITVFATFTA